MADHQDTKTPKELKEFKEIPLEVDRVAKQVVDAAFKVHKVLGPGLLELIYEKCLMHELKLRNLRVASQVELPIVYEGLRLDGGLRIDMIVEDSLIVELKALEVMHPVFEAQLISYLRLTGKRLGLLINFNVPVTKNGIRRIVL